MDYDFTMEKYTDFNPESIIRNIGDLVWAIDIHKRLLFANDTYKQKIKSLTGTAPEIGDRVIIDGGEDELKREWNEFYNRALMGERFVVDKESYLNGEFIYMEINFFPVIENGIVKGVTCCSRYKNEIKHYHEGLKVTEEKYLLLFKDNPTPMMIYEFDSLKVLEANDAAVASYGFSLEEFKTMTIKDYRPAEDVSNLLDWVDQLNKNSRNTGFFRHIRKSGEIFPVEITAHLVHYENKKCGLVLMKDISDREKTEKLLHKTHEALKVSEDRFKVMFESSLDGQVISRADETIYDANPAICKMLGYTYEQFIKLTRSDFIAEPESTRKNGIKELAEKGTYTGFFKLKRKDGTFLDTEISIALFTDSMGEKYSHGTIRDISDRILSQKKIIESQANLYTIINTTDDSIFSVDKNYKILSANNKFTETAFRLTGVRLKEGDFLFVHGPANPMTREWKQYIDKALGGEQFKTESSYKIGDQTFYSETSLNPIRAGREVIGVGCFARDITEKRVSIERIKESEIRFRTLIENSHDMLTLIDSKGQIIYFSPAVERIFDYNNEGNYRMDIMEVIHPDDIEYTRARFYIVFKTPGLPVEFKVRSKKKDGKYIWVEGTITNMLHLSGVNAIVSNFRDITTRIQAEEGLSKSIQELEAAAERQSAILNSLSPHISLLDKNGTIIEVNDAWKKFGDENQLRNKNYGIGENYIEISENIFGEDAVTGKEVAKAIKSILKGEINEFYLEYPYHSPEELRWFRLAITPLYKNKKEGAVVTHINISDRKLAELRIKQSNERYELVAKATSDAIWDWNLVTNELYWGGSYEKLFGYKIAQDLIGLHTWIERIHPDDLQRVTEKIEKIIENPVSKFWQDEYRYIKADGSVAYVYDRGFVIHDENKKPVRMVGAMQDITDRKNYELERDRITNDLIDRNKNLEQFTYIVSHNLRAPVANIIGLSDLICNIELSEEELQNCIKDMDSSVKNLDVVINDLNDILKAKHDLLKTRETVRLSEIVKNVKNSISTFINDEKALILTDFTQCDELSTVKGYVYSLFYNLISNSIKYKQPGIAPVIEIKSRIVENKIEITFKDNGLGIDLEQNRNKIFRLYNRFHAHVEGKGMGLFMIKTQLEAIGGKINIQSEVNKGTEFIVQFDL
jgi:PAS domain S-box-containing protein